MSAHDHTNPGHEKRDADFRKVLLSGAGLFGLLVFGLLISLALYVLWRGRSEQPGAHPDTFTRIDPQRLPPEPRLEDDPRAALVALHKTEDSLLTSYGYMGSDSSIVRVPITRAMELVVAHGLPVESPQEGK